MTEGPAPATPESLLTAVAGGDERAFAELYDLYVARVHGLARRVLRDAHLAEEVTQEVFLQVWERSRSFDPARGSARAWVITLAHRRAVDRVRSTAASRRRDAAYAAALKPLEMPDDTESLVQADEDATSVRAALAALAPVQREAIELAYFEGHTHLEVARLMQCPPGTAKGRIRDGLLRLRDTLALSVVEPA